MKLAARKLKAYLVASSIFMVLMLFPFVAGAQQATPSPSPTESPVASPSPSTSPTPTPTATPSPSPSSSPSVGGTESADKQKVLGAATTLGATSRGREIAKWLIASILGLCAFLLGLKILRSDAYQE